jgi:AcrR family transcriptional regulator
VGRYRFIVMVATRQQDASADGSRPSPATPKGERRREKILDAALGLFSERGYHATSIADIADRAGIAKSVIYDHFSSKSNLHKALLETEARALLTHVAASMPDYASASYHEHLHAGVGAFFRYIEERPAAWKLLVRDAPADAELSETHARIQQEATQAVLLLFCPQLPEDTEKRQHLQMLAEMLRSTINGTASWWYDHPEVARETLVEKVVEFVWPGIERSTPQPADSEA